MGITGLLPLLKSIHKPCNLRKFAGQTIGVDAYGWLHRGTVACAIDLALDRPTTKYVDFAMNRVRMLIYFGVTPFLVFDGDNLPSKAATEAERAKRREESKKLGLELYRMGKISQAHQELQKAVDVTPYMACQLIEELKRMDVKYIVAPFEADAQLAYLERKGIINGILSEDSDLLVFGAKRLLTKLDQHGDCVEINRSDFTACQDISLIGWTDADFRRMAILSGCDYLASINKMGLKTAYRYLRKHKTIEKVLRMLQFEGQHRVPPGYLEAFKQAELTFLHHRVFCPIAKKLVMLTGSDAETSTEDLPFIGDDVNAEVAIGVACGDLDPMTKEPIVVKASTFDFSRFAPRRQTVGSSADLKVKKPIDSFFKRMPLAELDPNSLTPSPTQQRLLEVHANASWEATPSPSRPQLRRSTSSVPTQRLNATSTSMSAERASFLARASTISVVPPTKRQRLCSDAEEGSLPVTEEHSTSPFFTAATSDPSPMDPKKGKSKKAKKSEFNIYSDDSVDNVMAQLPDLSEPVEEKKLEVLADDGVGEEASSATLPLVQGDSSEIVVSSLTEEMSQSTVSQVASVTSVSTQTSGTASTSHSDLSQITSTTSISADSDSESFAKALKYFVSKQNDTLRSKADSGKSVAQEAISATPTQPSSERIAVGRAALASKPNSFPSQQAMDGGKKRSLTPLQRLGQSALSKSKSMDFISINREKLVPAPRRNLQVYGVVEAAGYESDDSGRPRDLQSGPQSMIADTLASAVVCKGGSEDLIVPNSEDDEVAGDAGDGDETLDSEEKNAEEKGATVLDLGKFAIGAK